MQGQPAPSWWSSYRRTTQSSPWPSGYLMMHMCSAISGLSCYTAVQSHCLQNMGRESLTGATLLISHTALDSESAISPRNPVWPIYLMGGILLIDMWINLLLYFSSILGSDIVYWFIFLLDLFFGFICSLNTHWKPAGYKWVCWENDGKNQEDNDQLPCPWADLNL